MRKIALFNLIIILILSTALPVNAQITTKSTVDDSLFVTYDFENLDPTIYNETKTNPNFNTSTIPQTIAKNMEQNNQPQVKWGPGPQTNIYNDTNNAIHISFFLSGSDIISYTLNRTTMKRTWQVKTEWRKFKVNLTSDFSIDFTEDLAKPIADWQKVNYTDTQGNLHLAYYYENKQTAPLDMFFSIILPSSASNIGVQGDTVIYDMPPSFEDQLLNSPFLILGALAVILVIILIYRKVR